MFKFENKAQITIFHKMSDLIIFYIIVFVFFGIKIRNYNTSFSMCLSYNQINSIKSYLKHVLID